MESFTKHIDFFNIILLLLSKCQLQWQDPVIFFFAFMILFIIHKKEKLPFHASIVRNILLQVDTKSKNLEEWLPYSFNRCAQFVETLNVVCVQGNLG